MTSHTQTLPLISNGAEALRGRATVPGDKSISHRALLLGALATRVTRIRGLLEADDVLNTARAVSALGAPAERQDGVWRVTGRGVGGLAPPSAPLDFGNSGTGTRLMLGVLTGHDFQVALAGDASLSRRPMARVLDPLSRMGLEVLSGADRLPFTVRGRTAPLPLVYELPVPSAQVKSAILLAGLHAPGKTVVVEREPTRDHTERMLRAFGAEVRVEREGGADHITVLGQPELEGQDIEVPADPSSAAFLAAAAAIVPGSDVTIEGVLVNPARIGFYQTLVEMGADLEYGATRESGGEPVADIRVRYAAPLRAVAVPASRAPSMIDEYPILAVVAAFAEGETTMEGLAELKVKESDRLAATAAGLAANGVAARIDGDTLVVTGRRRVPGGGTVATHLDHRIAMAFLIMGLASDRSVTVDDTAMIATSFPEFRPIMERLGARFVQPDAGRSDRP